MGIQTTVQFVIICLFLVSGIPSALASRHISDDAILSSEAISAPARQIFVEFLRDSIFGVDPREEKSSLLTDKAPAGITEPPVVVGADSTSALQAPGVTSGDAPGATLSGAMIFTRDPNVVASTETLPATAPENCRFGGGLPRVTCSEGYKCVIHQPHSDSWNPDDIQTGICLRMEAPRVDLSEKSGETGDNGASGQKAVVEDPVSAVFVPEGENGAGVIDNSQEQLSLSSLYFRNQRLSQYSIIIQQDPAAESGSDTWQAADDRDGNDLLTSGEGTVGGRKLLSLPTTYHLSHDDILAQDTFHRASRVRPRAQLLHLAAFESYRSHAESARGLLSLTPAGEGQTCRFGGNIMPIHCRGYLVCQPVSPPHPNPTPSAGRGGGGRFFNPDAATLGTCQPPKAKLGKLCRSGGASPAVNCATGLRCAASKRVRMGQRPVKIFGGSGRVAPPPESAISGVKEVVGVCQHAGR